MGVSRDRIVVHIDELVLADFPAVQRDRVTSAFRRELTRLLREDFDPVAGSSDVRAVPLPQAPPSSSRGLGEAIARAVHAGLTRRDEP